MILHLIVRFNTTVIIASYQYFIETEVVKAFYNVFIAHLHSTYMYNMYLAVYYCMLLELEWL